MSPELDAPGRALLGRALGEWTAGRHYEAHELLEDVAECFDETDPSFDVAIALTQIAAALHKLKNQVGASAVPGKIAKALEALALAPAKWQGLDLERFRTELATFAARADVAQGRAPPAGVEYPEP